jgi:hemin uptake protein HemP
MRTTAVPPLSKEPGPASAGSAPASAPVAVKSEALFVGASEVLIDHRGVMYRLRLTSLGKLILTK